jgi:hypothetical protein
VTLPYKTTLRDSLTTRYLLILEGNSIWPHRIWGLEQEAGRWTLPSAFDPAAPREVRAGGGAEGWKVTTPPSGIDNDVTGVRLLAFKLYT